MSRAIVFVLFSALALQSSQAQLFSHGAPATVTSPTPDGREHGVPALATSPTADGRQHGVPASVVSPTQLPFGVNPPLRSHIRLQGPLRRFGNPHLRHQVFIPVPIFYSYYTDGAYPSVADPSVPVADMQDPAQAAQAQQTTGDRSDDDLRAAYLQGARDALAHPDDSRYGEHFMDSRERPRRDTAAAESKPERKSRRDEDAVTAQSAPAEDKSPATVFIFKDGHQVETRNYAIMGSTLFDFSGQMLKKIQLDDLDASATAKANDDRGVSMKLN
ncbi:MAG TPA: hypothetical protein VFT65_09320 [Candidatus Angelobacter sp.]|nr:hypothetical protein [Candidatus Angelobacter sp.]